MIEPHRLELMDLLVYAIQQPLRIKKKKNKNKNKKKKDKCLTWHKIKEENDGRYYLNIFLAMIKPHRLELLGLLFCPIKQPLRIFSVQELCQSLNISEFIVWLRRPKEYQKEF